MWIWIISIITNFLSNIVTVDSHSERTEQKSVQQVYFFSNSFGVSFMFILQNNSLLNARYLLYVLFFYYFSINFCLVLMDFSHVATGNDSNALVECL